MPDKIFVVSLSHPFSNSPYIFLKEGGRVKMSRDCSCFDGTSLYISYDFSCVIDKLRSEKKYSLPKLVDIQTAKKLIVGRKKAEFTPGNQPWILKNILGDNVKSDSLKWLDEFFQLRIAPDQIESQAASVVSDIMNGFENAWGKIEKKLVNTGEHDRFWNVENVLYGYFLDTQLKGINVPQISLSAMLDDLYRLHYTSIKKLELEYGFVFNAIEINSAIAYVDIEKFIKHRDIVKEDFEYNFWDSVELYSELDDFLMILFVAYKTLKDRSALLRYAVDRYNAIYPKFDIMGTVTGRMLITSPGIQYLKKTSRAIFKPKEGYSHIYADFDQFEPGIIASFSNDQKLIELYNNGDIYNELSQILFSSTEKRKISKIIFLAFMYGMTQDRMGNFIEKIAGIEAKRQGISFFNKFETLCAWKERVCEKAAEDGYASSCGGNRRYLQEKGKLTSSEKRWVPNQIIQGTASYIFKKSLIGLKIIAPNIDFLVPMHDAILVEVPTDKVNDTKEIIKQVFVKEFMQVCPSINANVSFDQFAE